jgi:hypothetical protein
MLHVVDPNVLGLVMGASVSPLRPFLYILPLIFENSNQRNMLKHRGYTGRAEVDFEAKILFGRVNIDKAVITFQAEMIDAAIGEFKASVDEYLDWCEEEGRKPQPPA